VPPGSWQSKGDYASCGALPGDALAWEYLTRNPRYLKDRKQFDGRTKGGSLTDEDYAEFSTRWGVLARHDDDGKIRWAASAYPGTMFVVAAMPDTIIGEPLSVPFENGVGTYIAGGVSVTLLQQGRRVGKTDVASGYAVLVPLDDLIDVRLQAVKHLADHLRHKAPRPFPPPLSKPRRDRLIAGLRALDGHIAGASYRDIAAELFGEAAVPKRGWKDHDLRDRTIRLVRDAVRMMQGGYRQLLLHPYRRHLPEGD
jgi:Uncharacterized conserved protein (DUF2285)/Family of unknown function (DUF6499)